MISRLLLLLFALAAVAAEPGQVVIPGDSKPTAGRLDEARRRIAAGQGENAIELLQTLIDSTANELADVGEGRGVSARLQAHSLVSQLSPADLAAYRKRMEVQARRRLEQADETGDLEPLYRLIEEAFCTPQAMTALDRLGDRAFEQGRFDEAESWWRRISPLVAVAAKNQDVAALECPDPPADLAARVQAKQLLARIFRAHPTWKQDLEAFRKRHPKAAGRFAGRNGLYVDTLAELAAQPRWDRLAADWTTFGGNSSRGRIAAAPPRLLDRLSRLCREGPTWVFDLQQRARQDGFALPFKPGNELDAARRLAFYPALAGHYALIADARCVTAYDLRTGRSEKWYDAVKAGVGGFFPQEGLPAAHDLRYSLTVAEGCVFVRIGTQSIRDVRLRSGPKDQPPRRPLGDVGESQLVSLSLVPGANGERFRWSVRGFDLARKELAIFEGSPIVDDGRVWIAASRFEGDRLVTAVHCYPAHPEDTKAQALWQTDVCETRELLPESSSADLDRKQRRRHHLLTLAGSKVVYCSHSGAIVALDARTGRRVWAMRYPQRDLREPEDNPSLRDLLPPLYADGRLYVAPSDSDRLYCLDPETGATIWQRENLDVVHLVGVGHERLIFTTWRNPGMGRLDAGGLRAVMADTGNDAGGWVLPDDGGGLVPFGRPLLVGDLVLWPTARRPYGVFAVRQIDGQQPDNPSLLHRLPSGNLLFANGCLLVADGRTLSAFVPPEWLPGEDETTISNVVDSPRRRLAVMLKQDNPNVWQEVLSSPVMSDLTIEDERGLPQRAAWVASRHVPLNGTKRENQSRPSTSKIDEPQASELNLSLEPGERFLFADELLLCTKGQEVRGRSRGDGSLTWRRRVSFTPTWARRLDQLFLVAGAEGLAALDAAEGTPRWFFEAPPRSLWPGTREGNIRVIDDPLCSQTLADFHLTGSRLLCVQGERCLLCLDAREGAVLWLRRAPGAAFEMPAPRGRLSWLCPLNEDRLLVQASTHRWLLDARTGEIVASSPSALFRWPRAPVVADNRVYVVPNSRQVEQLDVATGKTLWSYAVPGETTRSGEPPLILPSGNVLAVVEPLNVGYRLQKLDPATGKPLWSQPPLLPMQSLHPSACLLLGETLIHAEDDHLSAWSLNQRKTLWSRRLPGTGPRRIVRDGRHLLVFHEQAASARFRFRWLGVALQWQVGPLPSSGGDSLLILDAENGRLRQRLVLDPEWLPRRPASTWPSKPAVWPAFMVSRDETGSPGPLLIRDRRGYVAAVGNRVTAFALASSTSK